ncbi:MAG: hypothetical protein MNPFHGCM_00778 [Gemmatimonadaceae bacterium]|nr:hypothetical protein [Gemmatimonadaceae bacterium]
MTDVVDPVAWIPEECRHRFAIVRDEVAVAGTRFVLARPESAEDLISEQDFARDERLPYWADVWPSAFALCDDIVERPGSLFGHRGIELGCGVGLVACCAARAGLEMTVADYYDDAMAFAAANVRANTGQAVVTLRLDWRALPAQVERFDVVLAADVLYERAYGALVAQAVGRLLSPVGLAVVADPGRVGASAFLDEAATLGLCPVRYTRSVVVSGRSHDVDVLVLKRTAPGV